MTTFTNYLASLKNEIHEMSVDEVHEAMASSTPPLVIDCREQDEVAHGLLVGAKWVPRGFLDMRIESVARERDQAIVIYCAGSTRSVLAAKTMKTLGYTHVSSMEGGFTQWKQRGYPFQIPKTLSAEQRLRYSRHLLIPEIGEEGQRKLLDSKVLMLGAGGLGSPAAYYLAAAGIGKLGIVDSDIVDRSNLQRQILHTDDRVGTPKTESAQITLNAMNPEIEIETFNVRLTSDNVLDIFSGYDMVVDGCDNFPTRYLINDACVHLGIPNIHGSVFRFEGQVTTFMPKEGPCYRCLYPEPPPPELAPSCEEVGVLGVVPGVVGLLQAIEVTKLVIGYGEPLIGRLLTFDATRTTFRELKLRRDSHCSVCGDDAVFEGFIDYEQFCAS